ncbi:DUF3080 family protein [Alteromonas sp. A079]|uniref:DUF3080 family protein n=1 Tax=Alteromonas sp. A079 TaxID=3410268 RepID=UPI003B9E11C3
MHQRKSFYLALALLTLTLLTGCFGEDKLKEAVDAYTARLSRVLDTTLTVSAPPESLRFPDRARLHQVIEPININLREFYAIDECELSTLIAQRNTTLGKSQLPSQRFAYESTLNRVLNDCKSALRLQESDRYAVVNGWYEKKQAQFGAVWANMIQTSNEMKLGLSVSDRLLNADKNKDAQASITALYYLDSLLNSLSENLARNDSNSTFPDSDTISSSNEPSTPSTRLSKEIETQLHIIASSRLPATMWNTQTYLTRSLSALTASLEPALEEISCPNGRASDAAKIARNVFYLFFINEIQPIGSALNNYHYKLLPLWQKWQTNNELQPAFKAYISAYTETGFAAYQAAMSNHVVLWQGFLARCNLSPTAPSVQPTS